VSLPEALAEVWPGCGGGHTPGDGAATLKIQVQCNCSGISVTLAVMPDVTPACNL
jgi:hypothetical protein